jgi:hypothetical protein
MRFKFERFTETDSSFAARVTIRQRTGQIGFNAGAINRFKIRDYKFAILYFDSQEKVAGIELANEMQDGAIEIKQSQSNTYIRGKNFCDLYGIDYTTAHRFELQRDDESGFLYFRLSDELESTAADEAEAESKELNQDT